MFPAIRGFKQDLSDNRDITPTAEKHKNLFLKFVVGNTCTYHERRKRVYLLLRQSLATHPLCLHAKRMIFLLVIDLVRAVDPFPGINDISNHARTSLSKDSTDYQRTFENAIL